MIDWKQIPSEWEVRRIEDIGAIVSGGTPSRDVPSYWNGDIPWVTPSEITSLTDKWLEETRERITVLGLRNSSAKLLPPRALLITSRATIGEVAIARKQVTTNQGFKSLVLSSENDSLFFYYVMKYIASEMSRLASGSTFDEISKRDFSKIRVPRPPLSEQRTIAHILDTLDREIQETNAIIDKLQQVKISLLDDLLTRGLDENGDLRDPERNPDLFHETRLGLLPKPWSAVRLQSITDLQTGYAFKSFWFRESDGVRLLRGENVGYGTPDWSEVRYLDFGMADQFKEYLLQADDIIIGMDRTFTKSGFKVTRLSNEDIPSLLVQRVGRFIPIGCNRLFLWFLIGSEKYNRELMKQQKGMDIPHLSKTEILDPLVPLPGLEEQELIAKVLGSHESQLTYEAQYTQKLLELKEGLIDDLLTGRIRTTNIDIDAEIDSLR